MRVLISALAVLAVTSTPAIASPTHLICEMQTAAGPVAIEITADEDNSLVTVFLPHSGWTGRLAAAFTPDRVRFANSSAEYQLSRTDLSISRHTALGDNETGRCKLPPNPPKRAF